MGAKGMLWPCLLGVFVGEAVRPLLILELFGNPAIMMIEYAMEIQGVSDQMKPSAFGLKP